MHRDNDTEQNYVRSSLNGTYLLRDGGDWVLSLIRHKNCKEGFLVIEGYEQLQRVTLIAELGNKKINTSDEKIKYDNSSSQVYFEHASLKMLQDKAASRFYGFISTQITVEQKKLLFTRIRSDQEKEVNYSESEEEYIQSTNRTKHNGEGVRWAIAIVQAIRIDIQFDLLGYVLTSITPWEVNLEDIRTEASKYKDHLKSAIFKIRPFSDQDLIDAAQEVLAAENKTPNVHLKKYAGLNKLRKLTPVKSAP